LEQFLKLSSSIVTSAAVIPAKAGIQWRVIQGAFRRWRSVRVYGMAWRDLRALDASLRWQDGGRWGGSMTAGGGSLSVFPAEVGIHGCFPYIAFWLWRSVCALHMAGRVLRALDSRESGNDGGGWRMAMAVRCCRAASWMLRRRGATLARPCLTDSSA